MEELEAVEEVVETPEPAEQTAEMVSVDLGEGKAVELPLTANIPFKYKGETQHAPLSTFLNHYGQRHKLDDEFRQFKTQREEFDSSKTQYENFETLREKYEAIDKWAAENPDHYSHVFDAFEKRREHALNPDNPDDPVAKTIAEMQKKIESFEARDAEAAQKAEDAAILEIEDEIKGEMASFQEEFPGIRLDDRDEDGVSLTGKILTFMNDNNYPNFESAALTFLKPQLLEKAQLEGQSKAVKGMQRKTREGVVAESSKPFGMGGNSVNPKNLSYDELAELAKEEIRNSVS